MSKETILTESDLSEIPLPSDKFALVDLDGTLIDKAYQITDQSITLAIEKAQNRGWTIGLNSDNPLSGLEEWRNILHMNGPIVAERGAILAVDNMVYVDETDIQAFKNSKERMLAHFEDMGLPIWRGNPARAIRENSIQINSENSDVLILINELRQCSLGFFVRRISQAGNLLIDNSLTSELVDSVKPFYPDFPDLAVDLNHDYGLLILSRQKVNKRIGTSLLMQQKRLTQIGMIGNSMTDYLGNDLAIHYGVSNASDEFKNNCVYSSKYPLTQGVIDILQKFN